MLHMNTPGARGGLTLIERVCQAAPIVEAFLPAGLVGIVGAKHQMVFREPGLFGKALELLRGFDRPVQALSGAVSKAGQFNL